MSGWDGRSRSPTRIELTERERDVLDLMLTCHGASVIADEFGL